MAVCLVSFMYRKQAHSNLLTVRDYHHGSSLQQLVQLPQQHSFSQPLLILDKKQDMVSYHSTMPWQMHTFVFCLRPYYPPKRGKWGGGGDKDKLDVFGRYLWQDISGQPALFLCFETIIDTITAPTVLGKVFTIPSHICATFLSESSDSATTRIYSCIHIYINNY